VGLFLVGLDHHTAPLSLRERLYLEPAKLTAFLLQLRENAPDGEFIALSTCNRLEVYSANAAPQMVIDGLCQVVAETDLFPHLYMLEETEVVEHLMRVACGLESMVLGETQILGQVADALEQAQAANVCGVTLNRLFTDALHAGKRARTETLISQHTTSISHVAARLARRHLQPSSKVLIVGAGEMAETAAQAFLQIAPQHPIAIVNRTYGKARTLAERFGAAAHEWERLTEVASDAEVVITATSAPHPLFQPSDVQLLLTQREQRPLTLIDIAVPRNVAPDVRDMPGIHLYDVDDLQQVVDDHLAQRQACIPAVEAIAAEESRKYQTWYAGRRVVPVIKDLRDSVQQLVEAELAETLHKLNHLPDDDRAVLERFAHRVVNKLLHTPTSSLRSHAASADAQAYVQVVRELFALDHCR
jgi:glutamyl-tRNA reductase